MFRGLKSLHGYTIVATGGNIGPVHDFYFHEDTWNIRYLVADVGQWLPGRKVLIPPGVLGQPCWSTFTLPVALMREQVEKSPDIDTDEPISRQQEANLHSHFGWPGYWIAAGLSSSSALAPSAPIPNSSPSATATPDTAGPHLRSVKEVRGYHIQARDGEMGHVEDFVIDDDFWMIRYLVADTRNWLPGKQVLISPQWLREIHPRERKVHVDLTRENICSCPEFDPAAPVNRAYEARLYDYSVRSHQLRLVNMRTYPGTERYLELPRDEVARRALELWGAAGQPKGRDLEYWLQAEVDLLSAHLGSRLNFVPNAAAA